MPATATWLLPYPAQTDPPDVPVDMQELCDRLETVLTQLRAGGAIPGEVRMWSGSVVPAQGTYGHWVWADGGAYASATYPLASGNVSTAWKTHGGKADPGAGQFRVPDLRGSVPTGMDAMPGGVRANRVARALALTLAAITGEEFHSLASAEMPAHAHAVTDPTHAHSIADPTHRHALRTAAGTLISGNAGSNNGSTLWDDSQVYGANTPANSAYADNVGTGIGIYGAGTGISLQNAGGGGAHENLQPTVFVPYICKLDD